MSPALSPLTPQDLPALARLARTAAPSAVRLDARGWGQQSFGDPHADPALLLKLQQGKRLLGVALGVTRPSRRGLQGHVKFAAVAPGNRRRGLGSLLFGALEARLQGQGCASLHVGACPPPYISGGLPIEDTAGFCFLLKRGYARGEAVLDMEADLRAFQPRWTKADRKAMADNKLRKATADDAAGLMKMVEKAFPHWAWEAESGLTRGTVIVAGTKGTVQAFACCSATHPGWFGPMGTVESQRGKGLGRLLLLRSMELLKAEGWGGARIPWVGPVPFYARYCGAVLGPTFWTFSKPAGASPP